MHGVRFLLIAVAVITCPSCREAKPHPAKSIGIEKFPGARDLFPFAERQRLKHGLPALGVGIIRDGRIVALGMAGERRIDSGDWATLADRFDVASCSKAVTATVAARLVERGVMRWDMSVAEVFPDLKKSIRREYVDVTLDMLLRHRSGLDQWMRSNELWTKWHRDRATSSAKEKRRLFTAKVMTDPPRYVPDTETYYCNDGYLVAASMMEAVTGKSWEELARELVFEPLDLKTFRYGVASPESDPGTVWGHEEATFGARAVKPDINEYGEPPFGSPGGFLYATVADMLRFVDFHIQGANGEGDLLKSASFKRLHTPHEDQHFGAGWEVESKRDATGRVVERSIYHGGYSGRARANMWFCPESKTGIVIVYNHGGQKESDAYVDIFYGLLKELESWGDRERSEVGGRRSGLRE
jgi:CubicO group peptidase (beta-lactamase class C family)